MEYCLQLCRVLMFALALAMVVAVAPDRTLSEVTPSSLNQAALSGCKSSCGDVEISYPFGIGYSSLPDHKPCFLQSKFELTCNDSSKKLLWANLEVSNINVTSHQMVVSFFVSEFCSKEKAFNKPWIKTGRFSISRKENKFLTVGCDSYGYLNSYFDGDLYSTGCLTRCYGNNNLIDNETCWGIGCCQVDIPPLMRNITVEASSFVQSGTDSSGVNASSTTFFNSTCSYSFVVRNGFYKFSTTHLQSFPNKTLPMVIDWTAGDKSCKDSMGRGDYACKANSYCDDGDTDYGYRCRCKDGYEGNSYLGCTGNLIYP